MAQAIVYNHPKPVVKSYQQLGTEQMGPDFSSEAVVAHMNLNLYKALGIDRAFQNESAFVDAFMGVYKALATGSLTGFADATALRLENLDDRMTSVLFKKEMLVLWNWLQRTVSKQPLFQYNKRLRYGDGGRRSGGFVEGGTPRSTSGAWERKTANVRYVGVRRGITHVALQTGLLGGFQISPVEEEEEAGTLDLLELTERNFIWGDADFKPASAGDINYDGLINLAQAAYDAGEIDDRNVIDMAGQPLDFSDLEDAQLWLYKRGKLATTADCSLLCDPQVVADFSKRKLPAERAALATEANTGQYVVGLPLTGYKTNRGLLPFRESIFLEEVPGNAPVVTEELSATAPAAPPTFTSTTGVDTGADWAGTYYYWVSTVDDGGESLPKADTGGSQAILADQKAVLSIGRVEGAHGYRIYRGTVNDSAEARCIGHVGQPTSGDATFDDRNLRKPNTSNAFIIHNDPADIVVAQLAPLIKYPLAPISTTVEWLLLLYHTLVLKAPQRLIWFKNIGSYAENV